MPTSYGRNVRVEVEDNDLVIRIDTTKNLGPSKSGKTQIVATTNGNKAIDLPNGNSIVLGLNCYIYR